MDKGMLFAVKTYLKYIKRQEEYGGTKIGCERWAVRKTRRFNIEMTSLRTSV
jgi:hypothetical protein